MVARSLGAARTICWALVLAAPVTLPIAAATAPDHAPTAAARGGLLYVSVGSMFLGFFAWYAGLARGGVARISQIQLVQTPLSLVWSALLLGERISWSTALVAAVVVGCVAATQRSRVREGRGQTGRRGQRISRRASRAARAGPFQVSWRPQAESRRRRRNNRAFSRFPQELIEHQARDWFLLTSSKAQWQSPARQAFNRGQSPEAIVAWTAATIRPSAASRPGA